MAIPPDLPIVYDSFRSTSELGICAETVSPTKPRLFIIWLFTEKVYQCWL